MKIIVPVQLVPDRVEEIVINKDKNGFELSDMVWMLNEFDDHAIEQAILLKEKGGGDVTVLAAGGETADDSLFTAAAKGADRLVRVNVDFSIDTINNHALARLFGNLIKDEKPDLILTGVSNHNGFDGSLGPMLAEFLGIPYIGYVSGVEVAGAIAVVLKDHPGGVKAKYEITLPAVLGISSSEKPPRYVPVSKVRQMMKTSSISEAEGEVDLAGGVDAARMYEPEKAGRAEIFTGNPKNVADQIVKIIKTQGLI
jgi:electron transfer flavoprotein beta subunit